MYLTSEEYQTIMGETAPEKFVILQSMAIKELKNYCPNFPNNDLFQTLEESVKLEIKTAIALQIKHFDDSDILNSSKGGEVQSFTLGRFSKSIVADSTDNNNYGRLNENAKFIIEEYCDHSIGLTYGGNYDC